MDTVLGNSATNASRPLTAAASTGSGGDVRRETTAERDAAERCARLAWLMDSCIRIPGTRRRVGVDAIAGFVPGFGDALTTGVAAWIIVEAWRLGAPKRVLGKMLGNVALDATVGAIPIVGDAWDIFFKASRRNMAVLDAYLEERRRGTTNSSAARSGSGGRQATGTVTPRSAETPKPAEIRPWPAHRPVTT